MKSVRVLASRMMVVTVFGAVIDEAVSSGHIVGAVGPHAGRS